MVVRFPSVARVRFCSFFPSVRSTNDVHASDHLGACLFIPLHVFGIHRSNSFGSHRSIRLHPSSWMGNETDSNSCWSSAEWIKWSTSAIVKCRGVVGSVWEGGVPRMDFMDMLWEVELTSALYACALHVSLPRRTVARNQRCNFLRAFSSPSFMTVVPRFTFFLCFFLA